VGGVSDFIQAVRRPIQSFRDLWVTHLLRVRPIGGSIVQSVPFDRLTFEVRVWEFPLLKARDIYLSCLSVGMRVACLGSLGCFGVGDGIFRVTLNVCGIFGCSQIPLISRSTLVSRCWVTLGLSGIPVQLRFVQP
jgi:hypothetical protein